MHGLTILAVSVLLAGTSARVSPRQGGYPVQDVKGPAPHPAWVATYNAAVAAGKIPTNIPPSVLNAAGTPAYPAGIATGKGGACSWTLSHCFGTFDVVDAPTGIIGTSFDDGPQLASPVLYDFLKAQNQKATHFMIGSRILSNTGIFHQAVSNGEHIAIHTWSHPYMTTMTDMQVLGEIGWTAQIIYDQSGLVPAFWRPPYGDVDDRVRAIAHEVFGLYTVVWNTDTFDWCLYESGANGCVGAGPGNDAGLDAELRALYSGPKSPGLIPLEHELTSRSVGGYIRNYPFMISNGWSPKPIPSIWDVDWYLNAATTTSGVHNNITIGMGTTGLIAPPQSNSSASGPVKQLPTPTSLGGVVTATSSATSTSSSTLTSHSSALTSAGQSTSTVVVVITATASPSSASVPMRQTAAQTTAVVVLAGPPSSSEASLKAIGWLAVVGGVAVGILL